MTRDIKVGLVVSCSFVCLVGVVVATKLREQEQASKELASSLTQANEGKPPEPEESPPPPLTINSEPDGEGKKPGEHKKDKNHTIQQVSASEPAPQPAHGAGQGDPNPGPIEFRSDAVLTTQGDPGGPPILNPVPVPPSVSPANPSGKTPEAKPAGTDKGVSGPTVLPSVGLQPAEHDSGKLGGGVGGLQGKSLAPPHTESGSLLTPPSTRLPRTDPPPAPAASAIGLVPPVVPPSTGSEPLRTSPPVGPPATDAASVPPLSPPPSSGSQDSPKAAPSLVPVSAEVKADAKASGGLPLEAPKTSEPMPPLLPVSQANPSGKVQGPTPAVTDKGVSGPAAPPLVGLQPAEPDPGKPGGGVGGLQDKSLAPPHTESGSLLTPPSTRLPRTDPPPAPAASAIGLVPPVVPTPTSTDTPGTPAPVGPPAPEVRSDPSPSPPSSSLSPEKPQIKPLQSAAPPTGADTPANIPGKMGNEGTPLPGGGMREVPGAPLKPLASPPPAPASAPLDGMNPPPPAPPIKPEPAPPEQATPGPAHSVFIPSDTTGKVLSAPLQPLPADAGVTAVPVSGIDQARSESPGGQGVQSVGTGPGIPARPVLQSLPANRGPAGPLASPTAQEPPGVPAVPMPSKPEASGSPASLPPERSGAIVPGRVVAPPVVPAALDQEPAVHMGAPSPVPAPSTSPLSPPVAPTGATNSVPPEAISLLQPRPTIAVLAGASVQPRPVDRLQPSGYAQYRVGATGESLYGIAQKTLQNGARWGAIAELNPGIRANQMIPAGTLLRLPNGANVPAENQM